MRLYDRTSGRIGVSRSGFGDSREELSVENPQQLMSEDDESCGCVLNDWLLLSQNEKQNP